MVTYYSLLVFKLVIGFSFIVAYLHFTGKKQPASNNPIDIIGNYVIGGVIGGIIYTDSISILSYIVTLTIALFLVGTLSYISTRFSVAEKVTKGEPLTLVKHGRIRYNTFIDNGNKIDMTTILSKLHLQGIKRLQDVSYLQLEPNGELIAVKVGEDEPSVIIYHNDNFLAFNMERVGLAENTVKKLIREKAIRDINFIEYWNKELTFVTINTTLVVKLED